MRKLIIKSNDKHKCNLCDNTSEIKFIMKDNTGKQKGYLCDDCLYDLLKDAIDHVDEKTKKDKSKQNDR